MPLRLGFLPLYPYKDLPIKNSILPVRIGFLRSGVFPRAPSLWGVQNSKFLLQSCKSVEVSYRLDHRCLNQDTTLRASQIEDKWLRSGSYTVSVILQCFGVAPRQCVCMHTHIYICVCTYTHLYFFSIFPGKLNQYFKQSTTDNIVELQTIYVLVM